MVCNRASRITFLVPRNKQINQIRSFGRSAGHGLSFIFRWARLLGHVFSSFSTERGKPSRVDSRRGFGECVFPECIKVRLCWVIYGPLSASSPLADGRCWCLGVGHFGEKFCKGLRGFAGVIPDAAGTACEWCGTTHHNYVAGCHFHKFIKNKLKIPFLMKTSCGCFHHVDEDRKWWSDFHCRCMNAATIHSKSGESTIWMKRAT